MNGTIGPVTMFGYKVEAHGKFAAIGNPNPQYASQAGTGSIDLYRFNSTQGVYTYYGTTQSMKAYGTSGTGGTAGSSGTSGTGGFGVITKDAYGLAFDVCNNIFVVGNENFTGSYGGSPYSHTSLADVYLLNQSSSNANILASSLLSVSKIPSPINTSYNSFGHSVAINSKYIVASANSYDRVYVYSYTTGSNSISIPGSPTTYIDAVTAGNSFGSLVKIDKSGTNSILVSEDPTIQNPKVYLFESQSGGWSLTHTFYSITGSQKVPFDDVNSYQYVKKPADGFGTDMQINGDTIVIGAPYDASYYEFSGSTTQYDRGAVYIYKKTECALNTADANGIYADSGQVYWDLVEKYIGDKNTFKQNKLGLSVDTFNNKIIVGCVSSSNSLAVKSTVSSSISQSYDDTHVINGQFVLFERTGSNVVPVTYDYKKKAIGYPYMSYGYDVAISDTAIVVGSPFIMSDFTASNSFVVSPSVAQSTLQNMRGHAYISTLSSLRNNYHAGNIFYKNGEIVFSNTGSQFTNVLKTTDTNEYKYDINYSSKYTINEKSVICVVDSGEFNISTNPTALDVVKPTFDLLGSGDFDFRDLNLILLYIVDINTPGNPNFDQDDTFWDEYVIENSSERSLFNYYKTYYEYGQYTLKQQYAALRPRLFSLESQFDFDNDGKVSIEDAKILWKFFIGSLSLDVYNNLINPFSTRTTLSDVVSYITSKTSKYVNTNGIPSIKSDFLSYQESASLDITGSYLAPYITTIGLYNGADLVAVAKLSSPIKNTGEYPLNFLIKWDV
jgi:hypothetical protein